MTGTTKTARAVTFLRHRQVRDRFNEPTNQLTQATKANKREPLIQGADAVPIMLVGNKSDLRPEQRQVQVADGRKLAEELGCGFVEASARYNENVGKAFEGMIAEIEKGQEAGQPKEGNAKCAVM